MKHFAGSESAVSTMLMVVVTSISGGISLWGQCLCSESGSDTIVVPVLTMLIVLGVTVLVVITVVNSGDMIDSQW